MAQIIHSRKTGKVIFINKTKLCCKSWEEVFDYEIISTSDEAVTLLKKEIEYLSEQDAIKKEMARRKEELKEELKTKGIYIVILNYIYIYLQLIFFFSINNKLNLIHI